MSLGFTVAELLAAGRKGQRLAMGLRRLSDAEWLWPAFDAATRIHTFDAHPGAIVETAQATGAGREVAAMVGAAGGLGDAARAVWEDMCLLHRDESGVYRLTDGAVAFPTDWRMEEKIGLSLLALHTPIHGYAEQLAASVDRFMDTLVPGQIFGRANWFIVASDALRYLPQDDPATRFAHVTAENAGETLFVRCERQTLRRLPESGAILFTIGIAVEPLGALSSDLVRQLAQALSLQPDDERARRAAPGYLDAMTGYVKALA
jgi:dimethylamine monooxygenase subunit A